MSTFATQVTDALTALDDAAAEDVLYKRPSTSQEISFRAVPGQTDHETLDGDGFPVKTRSKDWLFPADQLKLNGTDVVEPEVGDEIRWTDGAGTTHVYRLMPFGQARNDWSYSDTAQTRIRIHSKRTGTE